VILRQTREQLAPYKRIRRLEFSSELPKTTSGKIRRIELRDQEDERLSGASDPTLRAADEFYEADFPELKR
jgi:acetyl-CoA synthetase